MDHSVSVHDPRRGYLSGNGIDLIAEGKHKPHDVRCRRGDRYLAINWESYHIHKTVEIRLHSGTGSARKAINWVKAHTRFVDWASGVPLESLLQLRDYNPHQLMSIMRGVWRDDRLWDYYHSRAHKFGTTLESVRVSVPQSYHADYRPGDAQRSRFPVLQLPSGRVA